MLLDDQVKLNDPGASQYIVETLAQDGWNGLLRFYEGEVWRLRNRAGDDARAARAMPPPSSMPTRRRTPGAGTGSCCRRRAGFRRPDAYTRYLAMAPNAPDAPFIRQQIQQ